MLKPLRELKKLPPDSLDIYQKGSIDRYKTRPPELEAKCYADFVAEYDFQGKGRTNNDENIAEDNNHQIEHIHDNDEEGEQTKIEIEDGILRKRKQRKVIRYCRFDFEKDPINFYRERLMLFKPWRNELEELENDELDVANIYQQNKALIEENSKKYILLDIDLMELARSVETEQASDNEEQNDEFPEEDNQRESNLLSYDDNIIMPDIRRELDDEFQQSAEVNRITVPDVMSNKDYFGLVNSLNERQQDHLMHVLSAFRNSELPFYHFISGEAGVGKSRLIKAIYQTVMRHYSRDEGPIEGSQVLITAFTGKAAHNVNGLTAHSAFQLVLAANSDSITAETLNTLRVKLRNLKLLIIDEISMMGKGTFDKINIRMQQIFGRENTPFGGRSVIALGDFQQLSPVKDNYVFAIGQNPLNQLCGNPLWNLFKMFTLTEIMRQKDDLSFAQLLGRVAKGTTTTNDKKLLDSRTFVEIPTPGKRLLPDAGKNCCRLMYRNEDVDAYNQRRVEEKKMFPDSGCVTVDAEDKVVGKFSRTDARQALHNLKDLSTQRTQGLPAKIDLVKGMRYMVTTNIDVTDGLFNGAVGILRFIEIYRGE